MMKKIDLKQNRKELNRFTKRRFDAVEAIMELPDNDQRCLWDLVFHEHKYNETTNPKYARHFFGLETDEEYKKKDDEENDGEMPEYLLHPLLQADFIYGYKQVIGHTGGGGRWRKLLNTITTRYKNGEYL